MINRMNRTAAAVLIAVMVLVSGSISCAAENDISIPGFTIKSIIYNNELGLYEVAASGNIIFYLTKDKKYAVMGNIFEVDGMKNVTEQRRQEAFKINFKDIPIENAIKMSEGKSKITVFTTSDCPWCKKLSGELKKLTDVSVYLLITPFFGDKRNDQAIWCARSVDMLEKVYKGEKVTAKGHCNVKPLEANIEFARKNGITGLPTIVFEDGSSIVGYVPAEKIKDKLAKIAQETVK